MDSSSAVRRYPGPLLALGLILLLPAGCARPPWQPVDLAAPDGAQLLARVKSRHSDCPPASQGQALFHYENTLASVKLDTSLLLAPPTTAKAVARSPLGRPLFIVTYQDDWLQVFDVPAGRVMEGETTELAERFQLTAPPPLPLWLSGRVAQDAQSRQLLGRDREQDGYWLTISETDAQGRSLSSRLLLDMNGRLHKRLVLDQDGKVALTLTLHWPATTPLCPTPERVVLSGLDYGSTLTIEMTDFQPSLQPPGTVTLPVPGSFQRLPLP